MEIWGEQPQVEVVTDNGMLLPLQTARIKAGRTQVKVILPRPGLYQVNVKSKGKIAEAVLTVHPSWEWVFRKARENVRLLSSKTDLSCRELVWILLCFSGCLLFPGGGRRWADTGLF